MDAQMKESTMEYEILDLKDAPPQPKKLSATGKAVQQLVAALKPGKVAKLPIPEGKSVQGFKSGISRTAGKDVLTMWDSDGFLYVKLAEK